MRTTLDIDGPILRDLKRLQKREGKPLGRLISDLLARALGQPRPPRARDARFVWVARPMRTRVDLADKEAVYAVLDRSGGGRARE